MSQDHPTTRTRETRSSGDPWHAFGYVVAGVAIYGFLGWGVDQWLGTSFVVALGVVVGASLGIYMTIARFDSLPRPTRDLPQDARPAPQTDQTH